MYDVVAIGEPVIDFVPLGGEQGAAGLCYRAYPGGGAGERAGGGLRHGRQCLAFRSSGAGFVWRIPDPGDTCQGIETGEIHVTRTKNTGIGFVRLAEDGERDFLAYPGL